MLWRIRSAVLHRKDVTVLAFVAELGVLPRRASRDDGGAAEECGWCVLKPTKSAGTDGVYIAKVPR